MNKSIIADLIALLYVCLFLYTSISKLQVHELDREQMAAMPLVGPYAGFASIALPIVEIVLALLIFIPKTRQLGLYLGTALMGAFTVYVAYLMKYNAELPCTCGGFLSAMSWPAHLIFNLVFVIMGIVALVLYRKREEDAAPKLSYQLK